MEQEEIFFAEYLTNYVKSQNLTWKKAAEICGIDRSLLMRYAKGEKVPRTTERIIQIADALSMNDHDKNKLLELYECERIGHEQYKVNKYLEQRMRKVENCIKNTELSAQTNELSAQTNELANSQNKELQFDHPMHLEDRKVIERILLKMLNVSFELKLMITDVEVLIPVLQQIANEKNGHVQLIFELNNQMPNWRELQKFDMMIDFIMNWEHSMLQNILVSENPEDVRNKIQLCISNNEVLLFDSEMDKGFYSQDDKQVSFYTNLFWKQSKRSTKVGNSIALEELQTDLLGQVQNEGYTYQLIEEQLDNKREKIQVVDLRRKKGFMIENPSVVNWIGNYIRKSMCK